MSELINQIESVVRGVTDPLFSSYQIYRFDASNNKLELRVQVGDDPIARTLVLRVLVDSLGKRIGIPNIFIPMDLKHHGHGKMIIARLFELASSLGYSLFIVDLVESFHRRLVARGATPLNHETVQITAATRLINAHAG